MRPSALLALVPLAVIGALHANLAEQLKPFGGTWLVLRTGLAGVVSGIPLQDRA